MKDIRVSHEDQLTQAKVISDLCAAGHIADVDPDIADLMGAFSEDAMSLEDALESISQELD